MLMMKYDMPRGSGKTTALIHMSMRTGARVVTMSNHCQIVADKAKNEFGYKNFKMPISYGSFLNNTNRGNKEKFLIDQLDIFIRNNTGFAKKYHEYGDSYLYHELGVVGYSTTSSLETMDEWEELEKLQNKEDIRIKNIDNAQIIK